jgi:polysaccharide biosynthesis transport protein
MTYGFHSLSQIIAAIIARWRLVMLITLTGLAATATALSMMDPRYTATATIIFNARGTDPVADKNDTTSMNAYVASEVDLMRGRRVSQKLAGDPDMQRNAYVRGRWEALGAKARTLDIWLANITRQGLVVTLNSRQSRAVDIAFTDQNPEFAAVIANGFARAYLALNLELRIEPARRNADWLRGQMAQRLADLRKAQDELDDFLRRTGMTGFEATSDISEIRLRALSTELARAEAERVRVTSDASGRDAAAASGQNSQTVQTLRSQIADQNVRLSDLATRYGPNHPQILEANERLRSLQEQLAREQALAVGALRHRSSSVTEEEARMRALTTQQKSAVSAEASRRSELSVLMGNVERARQTYNGLAATLGQLELTSSMQQPNAAILTEAVAPLAPSSPNWNFSLIFGGLASLLASLLLVMLLELLRPIIRRRSDVEHVFGGAPVLAEMDA